MNRESTLEVYVFFPLFSSPPLERRGLRMIPKHSYVSHLLQYQPWTLDGELLETVKNFQKHSLNLTYFCHHHHIVNNEEINFLPAEKIFHCEFWTTARKMGLADIRSSAILAVSCPIVFRGYLCASWRSLEKILPIS